MVGFRIRGTDPWREIRQLETEMNELFESVFGRREAPYPACNVWAGDEDFLVTCDLPGLSINDIDISVIGDTLTISGERKPDGEIEESAYHRHERSTGSFSRDVQLPGRADAEKVQAAFKSGVLTVRLDKAAEEKPRKIEITSA